eukprot:gene28185-31282_t
MSEIYKSMCALLEKPKLSKKELDEFSNKSLQWDQDDIKDLIDNGILALCSSHVNDDPNPSPQRDVVYLLCVEALRDTSEHARTLARAELVPKLSNALLKGMGKATKEAQIDHLENKGAALAALCFDVESSYLDWVQQVVDSCKDKLGVAVHKGTPLNTSALGSVVLQVTLEDAGRGIAGCGLVEWVLLRRATMLEIDRVSCDFLDARLPSHLAERLLHADVVALLHELCQGLHKPGVRPTHMVGMSRVRTAGDEDGVQTSPWRISGESGRRQSSSRYFGVYRSRDQNVLTLAHNKALPNNRMLLQLETVAFVIMLPCEIFANFADDVEQRMHPSITSNYAAKAALHRSGLLNGIQPEEIKELEDGTPLLSSGGEGDSPPSPSPDGGGSGGNARSSGVRSGPRGKGHSKEQDIEESSASDAAPAMQPVPPPAETGAQHQSTQVSMNTARGAEVLVDMRYQDLGQALVQIQPNRLVAI